MEFSCGFNLKIGGKGLGIKKFFSSILYYSYYPIAYVISVFYKFHLESKMDPVVEFDTNEDAYNILFYNNYKDGFYLNPKTSEFFYKQVGKNNAQMFCMPVKNKFEPIMVMSGTTFVPSNTVASSSELEVFLANCDEYGLKPFIPLFYDVHENGELYIWYGYSTKFSQEPLEDVDFFDDIEYNSNWLAAHEDESPYLNERPVE